MVEHSGRLRVGGVVELEAAIKDEIVDDVAAYTTTDGISGFDDRNVDAMNRQLSGCGETGQAGSDDDDVVRFGHGYSLSRAVRIALSIVMSWKRN